MIIDLGYARYQGTFDSRNNVTNFLGVRYASAPVGNLRFSAPRQPAITPGIQLADTQPSSCTSSRNPFSTARASIREGQIETSVMKGTEDCLFLNVHIPGESRPIEGLPVIVWIHGGGYSAGSAPAYPGSDLIRASGNRVVVVVVQYRLGLFGFLPGTKMKEGGALNAGLLDQDFALRWVQTHISKFGGDPEKVVIWGESAGAGSVLQHVIANDGNTDPKLFRAAMTSSTYLPSQYAYNSRISEALYNEVVSQANCAESINTLDCLRSARTEVLATVNTNISLDAFYGTFLFVPVIDGSFITQRPTEVLKQGKVNGEALLAVVNTNEGDMFVDQKTDLDAARYSGQLFPELGMEQEREVAEKYESLGNSVEQANRIMGEAIFTCPTYFLLDAFPNAYKGEFAIPPALHSHDISYYFTSWGPTFKNPDLLAAFSQSFISFVISLDPNAKFDSTNVTPQWRKFREGQEKMVFNRTENEKVDIRLMSDDRGLVERCRFWESVGAFTGQ
ncbi:alpha/beta-hydrolase [Dendrothele bispora CBS 962.96]|uniref:Carboxylic ester hydrolase n=1 Tax=Dendrothele bispora (strain CBS 962.96) TaxID=1314807 RepID=A0A4S8MR69_DENBC|nr:alpha/beta-hydrolase [Dendrothele bispora CBS 962.96]